jgi:hypothetical protein
MSRVLIGGDSFATDEEGSWSREFRRSRGKSSRTHCVAQGGSSIDYGLYRVEQAMIQNTYSHVIVSITHPLRFWHRSIVDRPGLACRYAEPRMRGFLREFADLPDFEPRYTRSAIRNYHSLSSARTRVAVMLPFVYAPEEIQSWRRLGLIPGNNSRFWIIPIDFDRIQKEHNSNWEPNHLPAWCRENITKVFHNWVENNNRDVSSFGQYTHKW